MAIIPTDRTIDWSVCGVSGGIPARTTTHTVTGLNGDGTTDNRATLQTAIDACPNGEVVSIPAGTYAVYGSLNMKSGTTIRGAGRVATTLKSTGSSSAYAGFINFGTALVPYGYTSYEAAITSGAIKDSASLTISSASGISTGMFVQVLEQNDASFVGPVGATNFGIGNNLTGINDSNSNLRGQTVRVTNIVGNVLTVSPALYCNYTSTPIIVYWSSGCDNAGIEDLTIYATNSDYQGGSVFFGSAYNCWMYNVYGDFCDAYHVQMMSSLHCEVRKCHFYDSFNHGSGNADNAITLQYKSSACLIIDNICERLLDSVIINRGSSGNVVAFNYTLGEYNDSGAGGATWMPAGIVTNHGAHTQFNLFEGNVTNKMQADAYWGTSSHNVIIRNWLVGHGQFQPPYSTRGTLGTPIAYNQETAAIQLWEGQSSYSVIGNVFGDSTLTGATYEVTHPDGKSYGGVRYIWNLGYTSSSDTGSSTPILVGPTATLIDHGNWDAPGGTQRWDSGIADHAIPNSLFLSSKPSWFGSLSWPAFEPATPNAAAITSIPAGYRYVNGTDPSAGTTVETPEISPAAGSYVGTQSITITCATSGASIRYTTNGDTPTDTSGTVYSGAFNLASSATVKAIAYKSAMTNSAVASSAFTITAAPQVFTSLTVTTLRFA